MGTVPTGIATAARTRRLISSRSPPVDRSITVSAPASIATTAFSTSASGSARPRDDPRFRLTLVVRFSPIPMGSISRRTFLGITARPRATRRASFSGSTPSFLATASTSGGVFPFFASSIIVMIPTS